MEKAEKVKDKLVHVLKPRSCLSTHRKGVAQVVFFYMSVAFIILGLLMAITVSCTREYYKENLYYLYGLSFFVLSIGVVFFMLHRTFQKQEVAEICRHLEQQGQLVRGHRQSLLPPTPQA